MDSKRKRIRLANYDYSSCGLYFITICTKDRKCILSRIVGQDAYILPKVELTDIGKTVEKHIKLIPGIDSYVIMPNHIHLIIIKSKSKDGKMWASCPTSISCDIRSFKTVITKNVGVSVFQPRFFDHIIRNEQDYIAHLEYIDENPQKWVEGKDEYID